MFCLVRKTSLIILCDRPNMYLWTSTIKFFCNIGKDNYCWKTLHLRCLRYSWLQLWKPYQSEAGQHFHSSNKTVLYFQMKFLGEILVSEALHFMRQVDMFVIMWSMEEKFFLKTKYVTKIIRLFLVVLKSRSHWIFL